MTDQNTSKNSSYKTYKILITILILLVFCCLGYMYKMTSHSKAVIIDLKSDKLFLINELQKAELNLITEASKNKLLSKQLVQEKLKLENIIKQLSKPNVSNAEINKYKNYVIKLNFTLDSLSKTVSKYKIIIDSSKTVIAQAEVQKEVLVKEKTDLQNKIETASNNLYYYNLSITSFKKKESGKIIETQKASRVNTINVTFEIAENKLAKKQNKIFYIQIISPLNNVLAQKAAITFGKKELIYSDTVSIDYDQKTVLLEKSIAIENADKGVFTINVFDKTKLILSKTLSLD